MRYTHHAGGRTGPNPFRAHAVLRGVKPGTRVYCCGPQSFMQDVEAAAAHLPPQDVHFEAFEPLRDDGFVPGPCQVTIASTGRVLEAAPGESLLQVLRREGLRIESKCEGGTCGSCEIGYLSGKVLHRDRLLSPQARQSRLLPCVSRTNTMVVLDL